MMPLFHKTLFATVTPLILLILLHQVNKSVCSVLTPPQLDGKLLRIIIGAVSLLVSQKICKDFSIV